jgi:hypothetical protein
MRVFSCVRADMTGAKLTKSGEWDEDAAAERGMGIVGDVVSAWSGHGEGRKTICFGATIEHCEELCRQFNACGVMAACFTSDTTADEREVLLKDFNRRDSVLRVLISVEALAKGFDVPDVGCVIDCRPLRKSLSTAIQMWGRGLRSSPETGKVDCILLDHSGNIVRFKEDFERIYFEGLETLDAGEKLDKATRQEDGDDAEKRACPSCGYKPFARRCMSCGHEVVRPALVEVDAGVMQELDVLGGKFAGQDPAKIWAEVATYARSHSQPEMQQKRAYALYLDVTGRKPPMGWHISTTPLVQISKQVLNKIRSKNIAYAKMKERERAVR